MDVDVHEPRLSGDTRFLGDIILGHTQYVVLPVISGCHNLLYAVYN